MSGSVHTFKTKIKNHLSKWLLMKKMEKKKKDDNGTSRQNPVLIERLIKTELG